MIKTLVTLLMTGLFLTPTAPTTGDTVVEESPYSVDVVYGVCVTADGDGELLDTEDEEWGEYNYISYRYVDGVEVGDVVKTVLFNENGECVERYDQIMNGFVDWDERWNTVYEITDGNDTIIGTLPLTSFDTYPLYNH